MLFPSVVEAFPRVTKPLEGCVLWPYLDVFGLATVGYGCLVDSVPEFRKPDWHLGFAGKPGASVLDAQRTALKARTKALHFKLYENATSVRLTQDAADALMMARADTFAAYMQAHYFPDWENWPADAQLAWMLTAWACGPGAPGVFKTAAALSQKRDWETMQRWLVINPGKPGQANWNPGVVPRNAQIKACLANAAAIDSPDGYATPALYWPGHVEDARAVTLPPAAEAAAQLAGFDINECGLTGSCHLPLAA